MSTNQQHIKWISSLSDWLDSKFTIPYTNIKYGLDPIFSLFPIVGDLVTYLVSLLIIFTIKRNGASGELLVRMLINATIDVLVGSIPLIGTVFDVGFRSNKRNLELMKAYYEEDKYQGDGTILLTIIIVIIAAILAALFYLTYLLFAQAAERISHL